MKCFSERLKELREENKLTMSQLAKEIGVSYVAIGYWESEKRIPTLDNVIALANFFGVTVGYMAGVED